MPHLTLRSVAVGLSALCLCLSAQADTVESFLLDPPRPTSDLFVGPDGDVWFADQHGLMRLHDGAFERMCRFPGSPGQVPQVTVSPSGIIYLENFQYQFASQGGLSETDVVQPLLGMWDTFSVEGIIDADERMFCTWHPLDYNPYHSRNNVTCELYHGRAPQYRFTSYRVLGALPVSGHEFWMVTTYYKPHRPAAMTLWKMDLDQGRVEDAWDITFLANELNAKDSQGRIWMSGYRIVTMQREEITVFAGDPLLAEYYYDVCLGADGAVWSFCRSNIATDSIVRFRGEDRSDFLISDYFSGYVHRRSIIDYDGRVWLTEYSSEGTTGLANITDGGWPPMRLMLCEVATGGTVAVEAQVINNGPVVGVDVYVALELNGQLLYWPNWQPEPCPVQVNLRPGHNQTATITSAPRSSIPPGTYTFWGCMTGRATQKLIGPLDRKFETLTVEVGDDR